jgi:biotin carboxyl carrier protein
MAIIEIRADRNASTDDSIIIHEILVNVGQKVSEGDLLCIAEGSKSLFDIESPVHGFIQYVFVVAATAVAIGELILTIETI